MVYVVLQRIILVQIETPVLCGSTKNHTGTNNSSNVYVIPQRIILLQLEIPGYMWIYKKTILVQIETTGIMLFYKE